MEETSSQRPWKAATLAAAGCSVLFLVVYSVTNTLASQHHDLDTFYWAWEESIPLLPWMIVPYMSIDAFFVASPFVCTSVAEIKTLARRLCSCIVVSGLFFWAWPLRLGFERPGPEATGIFGPVFDLLHGFDLPHNLFPSLHIALIFVLRWTWHRHVRGAWRILMHIWFALVTLSTVFTHQHQVVDVAGGAVLAILVFYVFPTGLITRQDAVVARPPSRRLAGMFGAGAVVLVGLAWLSSRFSWTGFWLLLWCGVALAIVAAGYGWLGPRVFRKYAGYLSIPARLLLAPYLFGLWLSRLWYWRQDSIGYAKVEDGVFFGRLPDARLAAELKRAGVAGVVDLCAEHSEVKAMRELRYCFVPMMDLAPPERAALDAAAQCLEQERAREDGSVYVHCGLGFERSALVVAWWLRSSGRAESYEAAATTVAEARPSGLSAARLERALVEAAGG